jgi:hypothetical protein
MSPRPAVWMVLVVAVGCGMIGGTSTGPDGLRTFGWGGPNFACPAAAAARPVVGTLRGAPGEREPVWLEAADGRRLSVVWPAGYSVRFEPAAALYDERGNQVARDGATVELGQINVETAAGTFDDPYYAKGLLFDGCYPSSAGD